MLNQEEKDKLNKEFEDKFLLPAKWALEELVEGIDKYPSIFKSRGDFRLVKVAISEMLDKIKRI